MRFALMAAMTIICVSGPGEAQSALQGPLASPIASAADPLPKAKKKQTPHRSAKVKPTPDREAPVPSNETAAKQLPADPMSFGMKWNGSNDSPEQTRVQNYNGEARGTGAEVGMKLHF